MRKLRAGIIGLGVGEQHLLSYLEHPSTEVAALCDFDPVKLGEVSRRYPGIDVTACAEDVLKQPEIDIVSIASYDNYHFEQIMLGLENDKHLFVEKPICQYPWQAEAIKALLDRKPGLLFSSNLVLRMSPRFQALKRMIDRGTLGELYYLEGSYDYGRLQKITEGWRGKIDYYSVVGGGAVHIVDLLQWLTGDTVDEVFAMGNSICSSNSKFRFNDCVTGTLKFRSGILAGITANFGCVRPHFHGLTVYGTGGTFINQPGPALLYTDRDRDSEPERITAAYPATPKGALLTVFIDSIIEAEQKTTGKRVIERDDVFKTMAVCFALEKSASGAGPVAVSYL